MADISGQSIGRYHLLEPLGQGGMAVVYQAYDTRLEREVAVKLIRMDAFPAEVHKRVLGRFEREAKALARMSHRGIVQVYDYGEHDSSPYLVMELLKGGTLKERTGQKHPWSKAVRLVLPVADALNYAHGRGILHRDVKPSNILLSVDGRVVLTDFGIAKLLEGEGEHTLTGTGVGVGTPEYMAPEQGMGREVDGRADVYALGVVLYELVTGRKPYSAETPMAVIIRHINDPLPRPRDLVPDLPQAVEHVLLKALAKKPEDRYENMANFTQVMEQLLTPLDSRWHDRAEQPHSVPESSSGFGLEAEAAAGEGAQAGIAPFAPGNFSEGEEPLPDGGARAAKEILMDLEETRDEVEVVPDVAAGSRKGQPNSKQLVFGAIVVLLVILFIGMAGSWSRDDENDSLSAEPSQTVETAAVFSNGETRIRESDGMVEVFVPEGTFLIGSRFIPDDLPELIEREVYLDGYWIDQAEVTNEMYAAFLSEKGNQFENGDYWMNSPMIEPGYEVWEVVPGFETHPVQEVTWFGAAAYCEWVGGRLPTEAEWEKAARGDDERLYPWGNEFPDCSRANFDGCVGGTLPVGSLPEGMSPYGVLDMAGNAFEWVADWYEEDYYEHSPDANPTGPAAGTYRVLRGGSWNHLPSDLVVSCRGGFDPVTAWINMGFRCARSP